MKLKLTELRSEGNVRKEMGDLTDLTASVKAHGVVQPLVVKKNGKGYIILAGHRRFAAAKAAGLAEVDVHEIKVREGDEESIQLVENLHRKDLTPFEVSETVGLELKRRGFALDHEQAIPAGLDEVAAEIALKTGATKAYVMAMARLSFLPPTYAKMLKNENLTVAQALMILSLPPTKQAELEKKYYRFDSLEKKGDLVVTSDLEDFIERLFGKDLAKAPFPLDEPVGKNLPCLTCQWNTSNTQELFKTDAKEGTCRMSECYRSKCQAVSTELKEATLKRHPSLTFVGYQAAKERSWYYGGEREAPKFRGLQIVKLGSKGAAAIEADDKALAADKKYKPKAGIGFGIQRAKEGSNPVVVYVALKGFNAKAEPKQQDEARDRTDDVARLVIQALREEKLRVPATEAAKKLKIKPTDVPYGRETDDALKRLGVKGNPTWEDLGRAMILTEFFQGDTDMEKLLGVPASKIKEQITAKVRTAKKQIAEAWQPKSYYADAPKKLVDELVAFVKGGELKLTKQTEDAKTVEDDGEDE